MSNHISELEFIQSVEPDGQHTIPDHQSGKLRLTNASRDAGSRSITPLDPREILNEITKHTQGWPVSVAGELIVLTSQRTLQSKKTETQYFAWLYEHFEVEWQSSPAISKAEFFEFCRSNSDQYTDATGFPHYPCVDGVLYQYPSIDEETGGFLDSFINFFSPATESDRELIKAFILTLFWGGPPGSRPAFLITSAGMSIDQGRGFGKTTLLELCGELCGGLLRISQVENVESIRKRIINQADGKPRPRVIAIDNVKTRRFSWADLESMITARQISGQALYRGNGTVDNLHTFALTVNGPSLSKDLAQRVIVLELAKPEFSASWYTDVLDYIEQYRWQIIGDIGECLSAEVHPLPSEGVTRFGTWESEVLCKVNNASEVRELIKQRQKEHDDDDASKAEFGQFLFEQLSNTFHNSVVTEVVPGLFRIPHNRMHTLYTEYSAEKVVGKNAFKKRVEQLGLLSLRCISDPGKARYWLFRMDQQPLTDSQVQQAASGGIPMLEVEDEN